MTMRPVKRGPPFVACLLLIVCSPVYGLPLMEEWTDLASIAGSKTQPVFPGLAEDSQAQTVDIEPDELAKLTIDVSEDVNGTDGLDARFGYFGRPFSPIYGGLIPPSYGYKPFNNPFIPPAVPFGPFGASGSNFASGLNSTGFFWNGAFFPFETTTTTTSAPSSGGNYYAFFFREGEATSTTQSPYSYGTDFQSVKDAIENAQSVASEHGFSFGG